MTNGEARDAAKAAFEKWWDELEIEKHITFSTDLDALRKSKIAAHAAWHAATEAERVNKSEARIAELEVQITKMREAGNLLCGMEAHDYANYHDRAKHADYLTQCNFPHCVSRREAIISWRATEKGRNEKAQAL